MGSDTIYALLPCEPVLMATHCSRLRKAETPRHVHSSKSTMPLNQEQVRNIIWSQTKPCQLVECSPASGIDPEPQVVWLQEKHKHLQS